MACILILCSPDHDHSQLIGILQESRINLLVADADTDISRHLSAEPPQPGCCIVESRHSRAFQNKLAQHKHIPLLVIHGEEERVSQYLQEKYHTPVDFIKTPLDEKLLLHKIDFLTSVSRNTLALKQSQQEVETLNSRINDLNRSVDGHNSFLDLMSKRDGLTGLFNRRYFNSFIKEKFNEAEAFKRDLSLIILNIDYFSEINKSCGQDFGDFVLNELSARITSFNRDSDVSFRLSGEEFAIILPDTSLTSAMDKAEQLRYHCASKNFDNHNHVRTVTVSLGVASTLSHRPSTHEEFINMADQALFIAKSEGRNRVMQHFPFEKSSFGTTEQNFKVLKDTISKILDKTKVSTIRSLQLLSQAIMEGKENEQIEQAQLYAQLLSQQLRFPPALIDTFRNSIVLLSSLRYLLHSEMLKKEGTLSSNEWQVISDFPYKVGQITNLFDYFAGEKTILLHHGERYDGKGYPEGLKGDEIPIGARIFSLVSAVAAMNSDRPYRKKLSPHKILDELSENAGKQFDPHLVMKLIDVIEEKGIFNLSKESIENTREKIRQQIP